MRFSESPKSKGTVTDCIAASDEMKRLQTSNRAHKVRLNMIWVLYDLFAASLLFE